MDTLTPDAAAAAVSAFRVVPRWPMQEEIPAEQRDRALRVIATHARGTTLDDLVADAAELLAMFGLIDPPPPPGPGPDELSIYPRCGSPAGYWLHLKERTPPCGPCKKANSTRSKAWTDAARAGARQLPPMARHGYPGGSTAHRLRREEPCNECAEADRNARRTCTDRHGAPEPAGA